MPSPIKHSKIYQNALQVQNACNVLGIINSFYQDVQCIREDAQARGETLCTEDINKHPVVICYLAKIASLAGVTIAYDDDVGTAFEICVARSNVATSDMQVVKVNA